MLRTYAWRSKRLGTGLEEGVRAHQADSGIRQGLQGAISVVHTFTCIQLQVHRHRLLDYRHHLSARVSSCEDGRRREEGGDETGSYDDVTTGAEHVIVGVYGHRQDGGKVWTANVGMWVPAKGDSCGSPSDGCVVVMVVVVMGGAAVTKTNCLPFVLAHPSATIAVLSPCPVAPPDDSSATKHRPGDNRARHLSSPKGLTWPSGS